MIIPGNVQIQTRILHTVPNSQTTHPPSRTKTRIHLGHSPVCPWTQSAVPTQTPRSIISSSAGSGFSQLFSRRHLAARRSRALEATAAAQNVIERDGAGAKKDQGESQSCGGERKFVSVLAGESVVPMHFPDRDCQINADGEGS